MTKRRKTNRDYLKIARNLGIPALFWAVCTVNPLLIIAFICSWIASSGDKKGCAKAAEILYIIGGVISSGLILVIAVLGQFVSVISGLNEIAGGTVPLLGAMAVADAFIDAAAICSHKGHSQIAMIEERKTQAIDSVGFFGSEVYTGDDSEDL